MFASEYKAVLALGEIGAAPDRAAIDYLVRVKRMPPGRTLLAGVAAMPPGTWAEIDPGGYRLRRYPAPLCRIRRRDVDHHAPALADALVAAARRRTEGRSSLGLALSSGIDSTVTLAALRRAAPDRQIRAFTAGFDEDAADFAAARQAASHFGATHESVLLAPEELPQRLARMVYHVEDPIGREEIVLYDALAAHAAASVPVLFFGQNADLLFGGMPRHRLIAVAARYPVYRKVLADVFDLAQASQIPKTW